MLRAALANIRLAVACAVLGPILAGCMLMAARTEEATVNPLGKAIKRFANGEEDSVPLLIDLILGDR